MYKPHCFTTMVLQLLRQRLLGIELALSLPEGRRPAAAPRPAASDPEPATLTAR